MHRGSGTIRIIMPHLRRILHMPIWWNTYVFSAKQSFEGLWSNTEDNQPLCLLDVFLFIFRCITEQVEFEPNTTAFKALEQLMGVLPAPSGKRFLPESWSRLMYEEESPILDFYPEEFKLDLNGKRFAWMGMCQHLLGVSAVL